MNQSKQKLLCSLCTVRSFSQLLQLQFFQFAQVAEQLLVKSGTQPFSILKTEKQNTKTPKNDFLTKKTCHIIANYDSPCMKMGGHFTILNHSKMSRLGARAS